MATDHYDMMDERQMMGLPTSITKGSLKATVDAGATNPHIV